MEKILYLNQDVLWSVKDAALVYTPEVFRYLGSITDELGYQPVAVINPGTVISETALQVFSQQGINFKKVISATELFSPPSPPISLIQKEGGLQDAVYVSGDPGGITSAKEKNWEAIFFNQNLISPATAWKNIYIHLKSRPRIAHVKRETSETTIEIDINLDGSGKSDIHTGLGFFDHQLDQIARHGNMDLSIHVMGDLHIDEHHTIEDVGLVLGECFLKALGNKKGIARYGFLLPMDDCLAQVALDFGGRPWLVWEANFNREKIGDMPTEMFSHFFKSFSDTSKSNLNISAQGNNEHHKIESIFKAFAKALNMAKQKTGDNNIPSTKGAL